MKYCAHCKRINPGSPIYCQYCGRTFWVRICRRCREANPREALTCRNCGNAELSETSGWVPLWMYSLKPLLLVFVLVVVLTLISGLIKDIELWIPLLIICGLWGVGFYLMPPAMRKVPRMVLRYFWKFIRKNR